MQSLGAGAAPVALFFGVAWYLISITPLVSTYRSARHLYLPSFGLCVAASLLLSRALSRRRVLTAVFAVLVAVCGAETLYHAARWRQAAQLSRQMRDDLQELVRGCRRGAG